MIDITSIALGAVGAISLFGSFVHYRLSKNKIDSNHSAN
jgi:hypothetical protein